MGTEREIPMTSHPPARANWVERGVTDEAGGAGDEDGRPAHRSALEVQAVARVGPVHPVQQPAPRRRHERRAVVVAAEADVGDERIGLGDRVLVEQLARRATMTLTAPVISVATQTLPAPSTAIESSSW